MTTQAMTMIQMVTKTKSSPRVFLTKTVAETGLEPGLRLGQRQARRNDDDDDGGHNDDKDHIDENDGHNDDDDGDDNVILVRRKHKKKNTVTRDREAAHDDGDGLRRGNKIKSVPADLDYKLPVV